MSEFLPNNEGSSEINERLFLFCNLEGSIIGHRDVCIKEFGLTPVLLQGEISHLGPAVQNHTAVLLSHFNNIIQPNQLPASPEAGQPSFCPPAGAPNKKTVSLKVTGAQLHCSEDDCSHHHNDCSLEISYSLSADAPMHNDIGASVICNARLHYITSHGYELKSERCSNPMCHTLHQHARIDSKIILGFQFSPYQQVIDARVDSIQCHIEDAENLRNSSSNQLPSQATRSHLLLLQPRQ